MTFNDEILLDERCEFRIATRLELLATKSVLRPLDIKDMAGVLDRDTVAVIDTVEAVARTQYGFLDAHLARFGMKFRA